MISSFRNLVEKAAATDAFVTGKRKTVGDVAKEHRVGFQSRAWSRGVVKALDSPQRTRSFTKKTWQPSFSSRFDVRDGSWRSPAILLVLSVSAADRRDGIRSIHRGER